MKRNNESHKKFRHSLIGKRHSQRDFDMYDSVKNNKRRTEVKNKGQYDDRMANVGDYNSYHSLLPKINKCLLPDVGVPPRFQEKWTHSYDFEKMNSLEKNLWNLILQVHPCISDGNAEWYLPFYFDKLVVLANYEELKKC